MTWLRLIFEHDSCRAARFAVKRSSVLPASHAKVLPEHTGTFDQNQLGRYASECAGGHESEIAASALWSVIDWWPLHHRRTNRNSHKSAADMYLILSSNSSFLCRLVAAGMRFWRTIHKHFPEHAATSGIHEPPVCLYHRRRLIVSNRYLVMISVEHKTKHSKEIYDQFQIKQAAIPDRFTDGPDIRRRCRFNSQHEYRCNYVQFHL